jgi:branched-chain amino acid aminotransferase
VKAKAFLWLDGKLIPSSAARVPILTHALHYGSAVFEGIRAYETDRGPAVFRLNDHIDRLFRSAAALGMRVPYSKKAIESAVRKTIAKNKFCECYVRPIIFYGEGQMTLLPQGAALHTAIAAWPWNATFDGERAHAVGISDFIRFHPKSIIAGAKISGYYAASVFVMQEARAKGFDDCILLDHEGFVAEGPGENIFTVKRGKLFTPRSQSILPGITRDSILKMARDLRIPAAEKKISAKELMAADEVFLAGTAAEVAAVGKINARRIGTGAMGPLTRTLRSAYLDAVHGRLPRYRKWLTNVK